MQNLTPEQREKMREMRGTGGPGAAGAGQGRPGAARTDTAARRQVVIRNQ